MEVEPRSVTDTSAGVTAANADPLPDAAWKRTFVRRLRAWFRKNARDLPWRRCKDPYRIWVSEIMLQQTQVATVVPYFERFMTRFPDVRSLAEADEQEVLRLWEGLGYYRRARQLHAAAQFIMHRHAGRFPRDSEDVQALPGIGRYTAGAILSIAHDDRLPILEANTIRLYSRLVAYRQDPRRSAGQQHLWSFAEFVLPVKAVGDVNQAMMELGSTICQPRQPACDRCPLESLCAARRLGIQESLPVRGKKTAYEPLSEAAVVVRHNGRVLLRQCAAEERWAGLWDFPRFAVKESEGEGLWEELRSNVQRLTGLSILPGSRLMTLRHGVTRFRITLICHEATVDQGRLRKDASLRWTRPSQLHELPLSVTGRRISELLRVDDVGSERA